MTGFVLDNSVSMRWLLVSNKAADQRYAEKVLLSLENVETLVPNLWHLEASNVLLSAEKAGELDVGEVERFIAQLDNLPIFVDPLTYHYSLGRTRALAKAYKLSAYDAAYLELAVREGVALASLDKQLLKAASKIGVPIYLKE